MSDPVKRWHKYTGLVFMVLLGAALSMSAYFYIGKSLLDFPFKGPGKPLQRLSYTKRDVIFQEWLFLYAKDIRYGKGIRKFALWKPLRGYTDSFLCQAEENVKANFNPNFEYNINSFFTGHAYVHNHILVFILITIIGTFLCLPFLLHRYKRAFLFVFLSFLIYFLFFTYWLPVYVEFWLIPCVITCILCIFLFNYIAEKLAFWFRGIPRTLFYCYFGFLILILASHNLNYHVVPYATVRRLDSWSKPESHKYYFRFFSRRIYKNPKNPYKKLYNIIDEEEDVRVVEDLYKDYKYR